MPNPLDNVMRDLPPHKNDCKTCNGTRFVLELIDEDRGYENFACPTCMKWCTVCKRYAPVDCHGCWRKNG
jgi:hypothetical protein